MGSVLLPFERAFRKWIDDQGMGWERVRVDLAGQGGSTNAFRFRPVDPPRSIVVTLHGAGNDALFAWVGLFKRLLLRGVEIFTFDLPGHGRRSRTEFSGQQAFDALEGALDRCSGPESCTPVHAIGVSLGGAVLLGALPRLSNRLASAVLIEAPLRIEVSARAILNELRPGNVALLWRERQHYGLTGLIPSFGPFKRRVYPLRLPEPAPPGLFGYVEALNADLEAMQLEAAASAIRLPLLLVYGDRDRIVPPAQGQRLRQLIPGSEIFHCQGGTHLSTPLRPDVIERLDEWLERRA